MQSNHQSKLHKSVYQLQWEDFEKRVWRYYEHLWYEVVYHWFEKWLKDWWIDLIVKKLSEKTKYVQCKNLKKQIDYDKIAWIYGRVVDELKFNVEFVIWAKNWFDYGAKKFAEQKWIVLISWENLVEVEKEYTIVDEVVCGKNQQNNSNIKPSNNQSIVKPLRITFSKYQEFDDIFSRFASSKTIKDWSHGVVETEETVNYRTGKPRHKSMFCETIFWPIKDYECNCGKYKWVKYKGIVCERCWVELTNSKVRKTRFWHIELAIPVINPRHDIDLNIHTILWLLPQDIEGIFKFESYVIISDINNDTKQKMHESVNERMLLADSKLDDLYRQKRKEIEDNTTNLNINLVDINEQYIHNKCDLEEELNKVRMIISNLQIGSIISWDMYRNIFYMFEDIIQFSSWPKAIYYLLEKVNVKNEINLLASKIRKINSPRLRKMKIKSLKWFVDLHVSWALPQDMMITNLPIIPPCFTFERLIKDNTLSEWISIQKSSFNILYKAIIKVNNKLKEMIKQDQPNIIIKNEVRHLQLLINYLFIGWNELPIKWHEADKLLCFADYAKDLYNKKDTDNLSYILKGLCQDIKLISNEEIKKTRTNKINELWLEDLIE